MRNGRGLLNITSVLLEAGFPPPHIAVRGGKTENTLLTGHATTTTMFELCQPGQSPEELF